MGKSELQISQGKPRKSLDVWNVCCICCSLHPKLIYLKSWMSVDIIQSIKT